MSEQPSSNHNPFRICVAPMMDWTDRHCRTFHRLLTKHTRLYTEMVTTGALLHGDQPRHLDFNQAEHPVALQLGGSEPADLAACARLGALWGFDEINLNCGCPSERVQRGSFGACLMAEPKLVADCVKAMVDKVMIPVTVKHRIGIDKFESYDFVRDFVGTVADAGCKVFIVHARNAILKGLSPKQNREVPPLKYEFVYQLKRDFPDLTIVLNGGVRTTAEVQQHLAHVDGVMIGREAYHNPYLLSTFDRDFFGDDTKSLTREAVEAKLAIYATQQSMLGVPRHSIMRHTLGLYRGLPGARAWRRSMSQQPVWAV
ncbi:MAG: tRNA dihydrouridine(20/20a) synthase DusA [Aeromicrobium sp.]|nr:tRNA dihydrouridine(20/20a) synthase DusA [Burkholderiales bacterium]